MTGLSAGGHPTPPLLDRVQEAVARAAFFAARTLAGLALVLAMTAWGFGQPAPRFDPQAAMDHIRKLAVDIGVRQAGSAAERAADDYIVERMASWGYKATRQDVPLPNGTTTQNLVFDKPGTADWTLVVGAHVDSKPPAPGANDNASGVATVLEVARAVQTVPLHPTVRFIFFGSEEKIQADQDDWHHFGSRWYVAHMCDNDKARCGGMICIDTVAGGPHFYIGCMDGKCALERDLRLLSARRGLPAQTMNDPAWSDHEPFEKAGYAVAYLRWRVDSTLHTAGDDYSHLKPAKMAAVGDLVIDFLTRVTDRYPGPTRSP